MDTTVSITAEEARRMGEAAKYKADAFEKIETAIKEAAKAGEDAVIVHGTSEHYQEFTKLLQDAGYQVKNVGPEVDIQISWGAAGD